MSVFNSYFAMDMFLFSSFPPKMLLFVGTGRPSVYELCFSLSAKRELNVSDVVWTLCRSVQYSFTLIT